MLIVLQDGGSYQGVIANTAYRGCACYMYGRNSLGQLEFKTPNSSSEGARACYIVDWDNADYTNIIGGATSAAMDYTSIAAPKKATFHYGGMYRTNTFMNRADISQFSTRGGATGPQDTAFYTTFSSGTMVMGYIMATVQATQTGTVVGGFISSSALGSGFGDVGGYLAKQKNANFIILNVDAATAAAYGRGLWCEFMAIKSRVGAGYLAKATASGPITVTY